jgi:RNA polymerase sigma factor (sigma-70 family)
MSANDTFHDLIRRVRAGDQDAATELVRQYEPAIRRAVRFRLTDTRLQRAFDSMDVCQSVMASFFVRAASGQYQLDSPDQLLKLLATMARNKLANQTHKQRAGRRDLRRVAAGPIEDLDLLAATASPSRELAARELLQATRDRMSADELKLLDLRTAGREWTGIAAELGGSAEALRKKLTRAIDRVARALGIDA